MYGTTQAGERSARSELRIRALEAGVTLFELVVTMGIVGILMAVAIPSYKYVTSANRVAAEINGLLGDLQFARFEAIKEGQTVTACVSSDGATCSTNNTAWNQGWIVFSDANGDGLVTNGTDYVLRVQRVFSGSDTFTSSNNVSAITFSRIGFATTASLAGSFVSTRITLHTSPPSNGSTRCMNVFATGLMMISTPDGMSCS